MAEFATADLGLAAFLYCLGRPLRGIDRTNPRRCQFEFDVEDEADVSAWRSGEATVNALAYWEATQELKRRLFRN